MVFDCALKMKVDGRLGAPEVFFPAEFSSNSDQRLTLISLVWCV